MVTTQNVIDDQAWYIDSGATNHITSNLNNLAVLENYKDKEKVVVGNGNSIPILNIGSSKLASNSAKPLLLKNILHGPHITKNLVSVSKFTRDNNVVAEFCCDGC